MDAAAAFQLAATVVVNLALAVIVGASVFVMWLRDVDQRDMPIAAPSAVIPWATLVALLGSIASMWLEAARMAEVPINAAWPAVQAMALSTHYGQVWWIGIVALLIALTSCFVADHYKDILRFIALTAFAFSRSASGHAADAGDISLAVAIESIHLLLVSLWLGEVIVASVLLRGVTEPRAMYFVDKLSASATWALTGIFATGVLNSWRMVAPVEGTLDSIYVAILGIKIALVFAAAVLGGINRFFVMPAMRSSSSGFSPAMHRFRQILVIEAVVLTSALYMAALLASTQPPHSG